MNYYHYHELGPDQLEKICAQTPVIFWPLGLLEHHGWHLPVGFDGIKAERLSQRIALKTGGVILPTFWWGSLGGHGHFKWTLYQNTQSSARIIQDTLKKLIRFGFKVIVLVAGHYPYEEILRPLIRTLKKSHRKILFLWGSERTLAGSRLKIPGDHAAAWETSYGLSLLPEWIRLQVLKSGRGPEVWPQNRAATNTKHYPALQTDPHSPLFAQLGKDPRHFASKARGEKYLNPLVTVLSQQIKFFLNPGRSPARLNQNH